MKNIFSQIIQSLSQFVRWMIWGIVGVMFLAPMLIALNSEI
jgi:hypothetical protein